MVLPLAETVAQSPRAMSEDEMKASGGKQLSGDAIKKLLVGNTSYVLFIKAMGSVQAGTTVAVYHRDERNRTTQTGRGQGRATFWWLEGNLYCAEQRAANVGNQCYALWDLAGTIYLCPRPSRECLATARYLPGNTENL